ncbi:5'-nucleotidase-related protein-like [Haematobia irritans]|uniref:5'-nucleotidase-related protein-like n=1 Tax=Haematobia irritans TaxID=7368 RepID=UPI003F4F71E7
MHGIIVISVFLIYFCTITMVGSQTHIANRDELFPMSIIHINDFHARFEPTDLTGGSCGTGDICIGGYARTVYTVKRLLDEQKDKNPVYFNAGDSFQGTLWYNIGRWNVTSQFLNMLPADAMTLGNHEFDHGVEGLVPFLKNLNSPMLVANIDVSKEPTLMGLYQKSMIIERGNRKIGVIGVILETTYELANTGNVIFRNESLSILEEAAKLKSQGANIIIVLSHCGYDVDQVIAANAGSEIDVIVGAHSHTFLYTGDTPPGPDQSRGDYPTQVVHSSGHRVLIVQAGAYAKYVGNITVFFDNEGNVVDFEGAPIFMGADIPEDPYVLEAMKPWKDIVDARGEVIIGQTVVDLMKTPCDHQECNLGNFFTDAAIHAFLNLAPYTEKAWSVGPIALVNNGALRVPLHRGNLSYSQIVTMSPFENILNAFDLPGEKLLEALEHTVSLIDLDRGITTSRNFLQFSGLKVIYDYKKPINQRVVDVKVRCGSCNFPRYEPFNVTSTYRVIATTFLLDGGDGFHMLTESASNIQPYISDLEALLSYTELISPIYTGLQGRIKVI